MISIIKHHPRPSGYVVLLLKVQSSVDCIAVNWDQLFADISEGFGQTRLCLQQAGTQDPGDLQQLARLWVSWAAGCESRGSRAVC